MQAIDTFDTWAKGVLEGFVAFPIVYYVVKNFGGVLWTDAKALSAKVLPAKKAPAAIPVAPVTNG